MALSTEIKIRQGTESDIPQVLALIKELAEYERAPTEVTITEAELRDDGFGKNPAYGLIVAEVENAVVGISIWYVRYSTWKGKMLYLEDIVVNEKYRGRGIGHLLFDETIRVAKQHNFCGMRWQVLDWNEPALHFYKKYNAQFDGEWLNGSLSRAQILQFESEKK